MGQVHCTLSFQLVSLHAPMSLCNPSDLPQLCPRHTKLLGLDLGTKTIGLALSDLTWNVASPADTIRRTKFTADATALFEFVDTHEVSAFVLGLPLNMDGTEGPRCQSTRSFAQNILSKRDIPIVLWDERTSTQAVTRTLLEADTSRAKRRDVVDKMAASFILQGVLDFFKGEGLTRL